MLGFCPTRLLVSLLVRSTSCSAFRHCPALRQACRHHHNYPTVEYYKCVKQGQCVKSVQIHGTP